jgi:3-methyladenine DNA glycosylase Tag
LKLLKKIRSKALEVIDDKKKRGEFLKAVASEKMMRMLREKGFRETGRVIVDLFKKATTISRLDCPVFMHNLD